MIESPWLLAGYSRDKTALTRSSELVCSNHMGDGWHIIRPHLSLSGDQGSSGSLGLPRGPENTGSLGLPKGHGGLGFLAYLKGLEVRSFKPNNNNDKENININITSDNDHKNSNNNSNNNNSKDKNNNEKQILFSIFGES